MIDELCCMKGTPVRLALGVEIDTTIGRASRPARYVADAAAEGGRRRVHAADPEPEPRPLHGKIGAAPRAAGRGAPLLVPVTWEDGSRSEVTLDQIEQAGDLPAPAPTIRGDRAAELEERIGALEARIAALELAEAGKSDALPGGGVPFDP